MIKLDEILKSWAEDKKIDEARIQGELLNIPMLHGKYLEILSDHRIRAQKAKFDHIRMKKIRKEYFSGTLDKETLDEYGWDQFELRIGTKGNIDLYLDSDDILIKLLEKKVYHDECVFVCEMILKELGSRTYALREWLQHERFLAGGR